MSNDQKPGWKSKAKQAAGWGGGTVGLGLLVWVSGELTKVEDRVTAAHVVDVLEIREQRKEDQRLLDSRLSRIEDNTMKILLRMSRPRRSSGDADEVETAARDRARRGGGG